MGTGSGTDSGTGAQAPRPVRGADGVRLATYEQGDPGRPTLVAVHGYPDNHHVWDGVARILASRFHVVTYDVRGTGASDKPRARSAYRLDRLVGDLVAVADETAGAAPVHLLAHDWGSVQGWAAVGEPGLRGRFASYTSVSGPSLDHAARWLREVRAHPWACTRQVLESSYILAFLVPGLAERLWRSGVLDVALAASSRVGRTRGADPVRHRRTAADKINGLQMYRANIMSGARRPRPPLTDVPVQVLAPRHDVFVSVALQTEAPRPFASRLRTRTVPGGHWVVSQDPALVAHHARSWAEDAHHRT